VEAFSPDNLPIFAAGQLLGASATGCNRITVTTISPQTQLLPFSMIHGFWAPELNCRKHNLRRLDFIL
jgi:benzoyl-CoA reductase subunit BamB